MRVFYCECGQKMKVTEGMMGKSGKCAGCGRPITVTMENTSPVAGAPPPPPPPGGGYHADTPEVEELLEPAAYAPVRPGPPPPPPPPPMAPPPPPPPGGLTAGPEGRIGFDSYLHVMDIAVDVRKLAFAVIVGVTWFVLTAILGWMLLESSAWWLGVILILLWTCACMGVAVGGVSRAVAIELSEHHRTPLGGIFSFVFRHILGLSLVVLGVMLVVMLAGLIVNGIIMGMGMVPGLGPILVGLLVIPLFLVNLVLWILLLQVLLVPVVMGVEDCNPMTALTRVLSLIRHHGGRFLAYVAVAGIVVSLVGMFIFFMLIPPFMTTMATSGGGAGIIPGGSPFSSGSVSPFIYMMKDMRVPLLEPEQVAHAQWNNPGRNPWDDYGRPDRSQQQGPGFATQLGAGLAGLSAGVLMVSILSLFFVYGVACLVVTYRATQDEAA